MKAGNDKPPWGYFRVPADDMLGIKFMKALEVSIDGEVIGMFVPPRGSAFVAMVGNVPRRYMRAHIMSGNETEDWQWQLPDVKKGSIISFRMVEAQTGSGIPPHFVR